MPTMSALTFEPPSEFVEEELTLSWRVPNVPGLKEPRMLQTQLPIRPNLVVHRSKVETNDGINNVAARICAQLLSSVEGISAIEPSQLEFRDGVDGVLLEFSFPAAGYQVVQMHALRLDGDMLTSLTLCTEQSRFSSQERERYRKSLASASLNGAIAKA
jgi:hypothetical protein